MKDDVYKSELKEKQHKDMTIWQVLGKFKHYYRHYAKYFAIVLFGMIIGAAGTALSAWLLKPVIDEIFINKDMTMLYVLPAGVILFYFMKDFGAYLQGFYLAYIGIDLITKLREMMLSHLLRLDMAFFAKYRAGELMSRTTGDIGAIQSIVVGTVPEFLKQLIQLIGLLAVVIYQSPKLALIALIVVPCAVYPLNIFAKKLKTLGRRGQEKGADMNSRLNEIYQNIELIKADNTEAKEIAKFNLDNNALAKIGLKGARIGSLVTPLMEMFGAIGVAAVIVIGGREVIAGNMTPGSFSSFIAALFMAYGPIKSLAGLYGGIQGAVAACERTFFLLDLLPEIKSGDKNLEKIDKISLKNVNFSYEEGKEVLKNVSFDLQRGKIIALAGPSGGGKSSIINLLVRFYDKNSGQILINQNDISEYDLESLRAKIALVTQNIYLFNDTVAQNIAYSEEFDEERVVDALKQANALEFVEAMGGIYAQINEHGKNLSGGQKQRIAIARALYKRPNFLIFDEATSALDNESEKLVMATIEALKKNHLILIIAHRLTTIENADKIVVISRGEVLDIGTDEELMKSCELYQKFKQKTAEELEY
ncbi:ABC transporter ATP-binding protein [Campylobacter troglodytis]|uniref:ABC transporter ATP-binding protein n=1 Tax=Campylobacter troglodytis TaxID=654363 RepID=UPI001FE30FDF|nr:ABC transporter ATP-binding protein [Campylobacter troglodytis]